MGYNSSRTKIQQTLTGRTSGTQVTPDSHQAMAEDVLNYVQEVENISLSGLEGIAYTDTTPVQPDEANCAYISAVPSNTTYTYKNFADENGDAVSITATTDPLFVILFWNKKYWSYLATTSAPHLHVSTELIDNDEEVPSSKAVSNALQDIYKRSNPNDEEGNIIDTNTIFGITDNPQYAGVFTDLGGRFLGGFEKEDGNFVFVNKVPRDIQDAINAAVKQLQTADQTLKESIDAEGKARQTADQTLKESIDAEIQDIYKKSNYNDDNKIIDFNAIHIITDNPEYIKVITDNVGKLIEAIGLDGIRNFFAGIEVQGTLQCITDNPEYIAVWLDSQKKIIFGFKTDGDVYIGYGVPSQIKEYISILNTNIQTELDSITQNLANTKEDIDKKINLGDSTYPSNVHEVFDNPEFISAIVDSIGHTLEVYGVEGIKKFFNPIQVMGTLLKTEDNPEYVGAELDNNGKILSYRDSYGRKIENVSV